MLGNPYDGQTLESALEKVTMLTASVASITVAERGYRGMTPSNRATRLTLSHTRKLPLELKRLLKCRQVVEPMIGHMQPYGLLGCNWLKGEISDVLHVVMCGAVHNFRMIIARQRTLYCGLVAWLAAATP